MAKNIYIGVDNIARKVKKMYIGKKEELQVLDYIESTGTQYIRTGVNTSNSLRVETIFKTCQGIIHSGGSTYSSGLLGARVSSTNSSFCYTSGINYEYIGNGTESISLEKNANTSDLATLKYSTTSYELTCGSYSKSGELSISIDTPLEIVLFSYNQSGDITTNCGTYKIYSCKIYDGDVLVRDFIPVKDENGVYCLYDKVTGKKFYNKGSGTFIGGEPTVEKINLENKARKVKRGYIGVDGLARLFFISYYPTYITELSRELSQGYSAFGALKDYIICAGGRDSEGATTASVEAFNKKGVHHVLTSLTQKRERHACGSIGGYALVIGGATATSASNNRMTNTIETYNNNLVKGSASSINKAVFDFNIGANKLHLIQAGGCAYSYDSNQAQSYDTNLVKTTLTNLSQNKQYLSGGNVGENILFVGGTSSNTYVDVYNNNNVHSTIARPSAYASDTRNIGCASTGSYLFCFGGQRGTSETEYNTLVIFDSNLTYTVLTLPISASHWNAFNISNEYVVGQRAASAYVYNNKLVLETEILTNNTGGSAMGRASASNDEFALTGKSTSTGTGTSLFNF